MTGLEAQTEQKTYIRICAALRLYVRTVVIRAEFYQPGQDLLNFLKVVNHVAGLGFQILGKIKHLRRLAARTFIEYASREHLQFQRIGADFRRRMAITVIEITSQFIDAINDRQQLGAGKTSVKFGPFFIGHCFSPERRGFERSAAARD